jgi:hypothetical protein
MTAMLVAITKLPMASFAMTAIRGAGGKGSLDQRSIRAS